MVAGHRVPEQDEGGSNSLELTTQNCSGGGNFSCDVNCSCDLQLVKVVAGHSVPEQNEGGYNSLELTTQNYTGGGTCSCDVNYSCDQQLVKVMAGHSVPEQDQGGFNSLELTTQKLVLPRRKYGFSKAVSLPQVCFTLDLLL